MRRLSVLLVDDEEGVLLTLSANLELDGFQVIEASSGNAALALIEDGAEVDIVLSDIRMPGLSGIDLATRLRELRPRLPVVLMTAFTSYEDLRRGLDAGVFTILSKPFDIESAAVTLRSASSNPKVLVVDDRAEDATSLATALKSAGLEVVTAFNGASAIAAIRKGDVDVCVTDLNMPGINGMQIVEQVRSTESAVRCIVFSGHQVPEMMQKAAERGVLACLRKPIEVRRLLEVIASARSHPATAK